MSIAPAWHGVHWPSLEWNQSIHLTDLRCSSNWLQRCRFYRPEVECTPAWGGTHSGLRWGARRSEMGCVLAWDGVRAGLRWSMCWPETEYTPSWPEMECKLAWDGVCGSQTWDGVVWQVWDGVFNCFVAVMSHNVHVGKYKDMFTLLTIYIYSTYPSSLFFYLSL